VPGGFEQHLNKQRCPRDTLLPVSSTAPNSAEETAPLTAEGHTPMWHSRDLRRPVEDHERYRPERDDILIGYARCSTDTKTSPPNTTDSPASV